MVKGHAEIRIKRVYDPSDEADGTRVPVDRLWPRGLRKENVVLTLWLKEIAPSPDLRKWFGHDPARWAEFSRRYRAELARNDESVAKVADLAKRGPLTLLYAAHDTAHNHALVLAAYLRDHLKDGHGHPADSGFSVREPEDLIRSEVTALRARGI